MSDPLRADGSPDLEARSDADRDAKIEQLLLTGLDHYFAAQHEQAINVWTRALFLDRSHPRARAYIERARSALAERSRASEELLQNGMAAFHRGEGSEARRLLQAAIDGGAPSDEAFAILDRLDRLEQAPAPQRRDRSHEEKPRVAPPAEEDDRTSRTVLVVALAIAMLVALAIAGVYFAAGPDRLPLRALTTFERAPAAVAPIVQPGLPLPRRGELALTRARSLAASGHLHDALTELDAIRATDPQRAEADRLKVDIQRQLLSALQASGGKGERRQP